MAKHKTFPDYIFETSWEVCNKVGGIYTVLSTRAQSLQKLINDRIIFLGPDCWGDKLCPFFEEDSSILSEWVKHVASTELKIKVGRWLIPGSPIAILVDYKHYFKDKNSIYGKLWEDFGVDSLHAYGDYDDSAMFSFAVAKVVEDFYHYNVKATDKVVFHANEWQTGFAALMIEKLVPEIATMFTTHATCIGRSIAGNNKPLYDYLFAYNGDQMAVELNMQSKHSIEKQTAKYVDCFTTVSDITANECKELLDKSVDVVLPNGFDNAFVPKGAAFTSKRKAARKRLLAIANALTGCDFDDDTLVISTSGRYEFRSKGLDVFIEAMNRLRFDDRLHRNVVAFIEVPGWTIGPREDLQERLASGNKFDTALCDPRYTHWLHNAGQDSVLGMMNYLDMHNRKEDKVKVIFVPSYLIGDDGIVNIPYYNMVLGNDLCVYPSYYEPWGYTPLEAVAFKVPCITTDLAGFGLWANSIKGGYSEIGDGVKVVHRTDYNYSEVADAIKDTVVEFSLFSADEVKASRTNAERISKKALWDKFMTYYIDAYDFALRKCDERNSVK
ncbi:MAG: glycogen/starch synthase [Prevotella sp.]|jgi:glycosyltransferase involved in cell wall biosynthesis|nr:glycogen/starch synthase [Prevotella sp.]